MGDEETRRVRAMSVAGTSSAPPSTQHVFSPLLCDPPGLCCPLTNCLLVDPVTVADGKTYERSAWDAWIRDHDRRCALFPPLLSRARMGAGCIQT